MTNLEKLIQEVDKCHTDFELQKINLKIQLLSNNSSAMGQSTIEDVQILSNLENRCCTDDMEEFDLDKILIDFGKTVLQERFLKLVRVNEKFIEGIIDLNPNFFLITDADVCNFWNDYDKTLFKNLEE